MHSSVAASAGLYGLIQLESEIHTLAARQSLWLGEVWDFVIRSMCVVSSWILTGTNNMMCDHGEMERRGDAAL